MPAILGPGSVSLETCASEAQARMYRICFPPAGSLSAQKKRPAFEKAVDPTSGANHLNSRWPVTRHLKLKE